MQGCERIDLDTVSPQQRSWMMSQVRSRDTIPEKAVRSLIHRMGFRFRLHKSGLPGKPDIVLARHKKVIFVHGCFWHQHENCPSAKRPKSNQVFWNTKLDENIQRDKSTERTLEQSGWRVQVVWECDLAGCQWRERVIWHLARRSLHSAKLEFGRFKLWHEGGECIQAFL